MWPGYEAYCYKCKKHSYMLFDAEMEETFCSVCYTPDKPKSPVILVLVSRPRDVEPSTADN